MASPAWSCSYPLMYFSYDHDDQDAMLIVGFLPPFGSHSWHFKEHRRSEQGRRPGTADAPALTAVRAPVQPRRAMRTAHPALLAALALAACSSPRTPPPAAPVAPAPTAAAEDASAAPVARQPPADPRREAVLAAWRVDASARADPPSLVAGPVDYPGDGVHVAAVVASGGEARLVVTAVPFVAGSQASASLMISGDPAAVIAGVSVRDVNRDQRPDVAVFLREEYRLEDYLPLQRFALFYTLRTQPERSLAQLVRSEVELLGVRDDEALAAAIPTQGSYEPPADGVSPVRFIARLGYATPAQFRQAVAATGLRLCTDLPDRTGVRRKRCANMPAARLTDALITGRIRRDLGGFTDVLTDDPDGLTMPSCQRAGREVHCNANIGGPSGVDWSLVGDGAAMRLVELSPWAESS